MSTLSDTSNKYALAALRERRAELAGEITAAEQHLRHLKQTILHVDGTLRLFDPAADPSKIAAKRPYKRTKLFGAGKLNRLILDALRKEGRPVTTAEVVATIVTELGFGEDAARGLRNRVRANLRYLEKGDRALKEASGPGATWKLA